MPYTYSDLLLFYARKGLVGPLRRSAFRKFSRRNAGRKIVAACQYGFLMSTVIGDSVDDQIAVHGIHERGVSHAVERLARESGSFLDIGCNIGYFSCLFGVTSSGKRLLCIDPNPAMIERARENLELNRIGHYELLNCGVGARRETLTLNIPRSRHSLSSFAYVPQKGGTIETIQAQVRPLSELIVEYGIKESLVKIDTEGFEYAVLCGLSDDLVGRIRFMILELSVDNMRRAGSSVSEIFSLPIMEEFDVHVVRDKAEGFVERVDSARLADDGALNANVLLVRKSGESKEAFERSGIRRR